MVDQLDSDFHEFSWLWALDSRHFMTFTKNQALHKCHSGYHDFSFTRAPFYVITREQFWSHGLFAFYTPVSSIHKWRAGKNRSQVFTISPFSQNAMHLLVIPTHLVLLYSNTRSHVRRLLLSLLPECIVRLSCSYTVFKSFIFLCKKVCLCRHASKIRLEVWLLAVNIFSA